MRFTTMRHRVLVQGVSRRAIAKEMGVSRNTVKRYVEGALAGHRVPVDRAKPVLGRARARLDALLAESPRWTGGKPRLTATRLWRMLREEGISIGETSVKIYVREWKRRRAEVFVPLVYRPGDLAEVDFFEVLVDVAGKSGYSWQCAVAFVVGCHARTLSFGVVSSTRRQRIQNSIHRGCSPW